MDWIMRRITYANVASTLALFLALGGTAYAANGGSFLLGKSNTASSTTTLTNTGSSSVLNLLAKSGQPPLATNSGKTVHNLSADRLDGIDSSTFARASGETGYIIAFNDGIGEAAATCPAGTKLTGGGGYAAGDTNVLWFSSADLVTAQTWAADATPDNEDVYAVAVCYNPKGSVPGAASVSSITALHTDLSRIAARRSALQRHKAG
jgi:hypothetical protein